jgi:hypothetical protein
VGGLLAPLAVALLDQAALHLPGRTHPVFLERSGAPIKGPAVQPFGRTRTRVGRLEKVFRWVKVARWTPSSLEVDFSRRWAPAPNVALVPTVRPDAVAERSSESGVRVYISWNGAKEVESWEVLVGEHPGHLESVGSVPRDGFETAMVAQTSDSYIAVRAKGRPGSVPGTTEPINTLRCDCSKCLKAGACIWARVVQERSTGLSKFTLS